MKNTRVFLIALCALTLCACAVTQNSKTEGGEKLTEEASTVAEQPNAGATSAPAADKTPAAPDTSPDPAPAAPASTGEMVTLPSGLSYQDLIVGDGASPEKGQTVVVHYTGWLSVGGEPGEKFDSSLDRGETFKFPIGVGRVIKGWDEGVATMKIGGRRRLVVPPELGYGDRDLGVIPPNSTLIFDVQLFGLE